jgi:hypothetical protein
MKPTVRITKLKLVVALVLAALAIPAAASASEPVRMIERQQQSVEQQLTVNPCTLDPGIVTEVENSHRYITVYEDGRVHVQGTLTGSFRLDTFDPSKPDYAGHFTVNLGSDESADTERQSVVVAILAKGTDGSQLHFHQKVHILTVDGDVQVALDQVSCG